MAVTESVPSQQRLHLARFIVPIDQGRACEKAIPAALAVAEAAGGRVELAAVVVTDHEAIAMGRRLRALADRFGTGYKVRVDWDIAAALTKLGAEAPDTLLCVAAHGRGAIGRAILGSVSAELIAASDRPVLLVGPAYNPSRGLKSSPVLAALDGSDAATEIIPAAAAWALTLAVPLVLATVAELTPEPIDGQQLHRLFGPPDPQRYLDQLTSAWKRRLNEVTGTAIFDPIGPVQGISRYLSDQRAGLVVVGTRPRTVARSLLGSVSTNLVRTSPVPVLAIPRRR